MQFGVRFLPETVDVELHILVSEMFEEDILRFGRRLPPGILSGRTDY